MIREHLFAKRAPADPMFRWRGGDVSRLEALSDAVFAFALALIVITVDAPETYDALWQTVRAFPVFAVCFAILIFIWHEHYRFFRRYGLEDGVTVLLNTLLLFLVLFYVYPLRFTFWWLIGGVMGVDTSGAFAGMERPELWEARTNMMLLFSAGWTALYTVFLLLHLHARRKADELELDALERYLTSTSISSNLLMIGIGSVSIALTLWVAPGWGGIVYFLTGPLSFWHGFWRGRGAHRLNAELVPVAAGGAVVASVEEGR